MEKANSNFFTFLQFFHHCQRMSALVDSSKCVFQKLWVNLILKSLKCQQWVFPCTQPLVEQPRLSWWNGSALFARQPMKLQAGCWCSGSHTGQSSPQSIAESRSPGFFDAAAVRVGLPSPAGLTKLSCTLGIPCSCKHCFFARSPPSAGHVLFLGLIEGS